jgi:hypothetical protein
MEKIMIYINTNAEIIADQVDAHLLPEPAAQQAVAEMYLEEYAEAIGPVAYETESTFREWRGGSMSGRQHLGELVAWDDAAERELATKIFAALEALITRLTEVEIGSRADAPKTIAVCLAGDDRERTYPVAWFGAADFSRWEREDGSAIIGTVPVALVQVQDQDRETLVAEHPDYGWCSVGSESCRDFEPAAGFAAMTDARLEEAR